LQPFGPNVTLTASANVLRPNGKVTGRCVIKNVFEHARPPSGHDSVARRCKARAARGIEHCRHCSSQAMRSISTRGVHEPAITPLFLA
jgi:ribosomal protein L40E